MSTKQEVLDQIDLLVKSNGKLKASDFNPLLKAMVNLEPEEPYKKIVMLVSQTDTYAPDIRIVENTTDVDIVSTHWNGTGNYGIVFSESEFLNDWVFVPITGRIVSMDDAGDIEMSKHSPTGVGIQTWKFVDDSFQRQNNLLDNNLFEIRFYPPIEEESE